jgi:metallo-beta-lactamase class B
VRSRRGRRGERGRRGAEAQRRGGAEVARAAAGQDHVALFNRICVDPADGPRQAPPRERWHAEPVKVFDNLYFVGTREHGAWAVVGSEGLIVIDALYDYAVEDEVVGGLKKLGLAPARGW